MRPTRSLFPGQGVQAVRRGFIFPWAPVAGTRWNGFSDERHWHGAHFNCYGVINRIELEW